MSHERDKYFSTFFKKLYKHFSKPSQSITKPMVYQIVCNPNLNINFLVFNG